MEFYYYCFPEDSKPEDRFAEGCGVVLKNGDLIYPETIPDERNPLIDFIDDTLEGLSYNRAMELLKKYGGKAWTEHTNQDGSVEIRKFTLRG